MCGGMGGEGEVIISALHGHNVKERASKEGGEGGRQRAGGGARGEGGRGKGGGGGAGERGEGRDGRHGVAEGREEGGQEPDE